MTNIVGPHVGSLPSDRESASTPSTSTQSSLAAELEEARRELKRARSALRDLSKVGMALMSERDPAQLFDLILRQARALTTSDAGSLYLVETSAGGGRVLHFLRSQN